MTSSTITRTLLTVLLGMLAQATHAEPVNLVPNAKFVLEFPELPETFRAKTTNDKRPPMLTAQLPENYTSAGQYPLCIFLSGGNGGPAEEFKARSIISTRDFIAVNLPLFKDQPSAHPPVIPGFPIDPARIILPDDFAILSRCYRVMLQKLFDTVPNITPQRSAIGGFSNGGHAIAVLLAGKDEFIQAHFTAFCFVEGGMALALDPAALQQPALKSSRFLLMLGDGPDAVGRKAAEPLLAPLLQQAASLKLDFTHAVMRGVGHQLLPAYEKQIGQWVRGEKLP